MNTDNRNTSVNHQDHPHREGNMNNTPSAEGQRTSDNNNQPMSNMLNESEEQRAGRSHDQQDESKIQQDQRQP